MGEGFGVGVKISISNFSLLTRTYRGHRVDGVLTTIPLNPPPVYCKAASETTSVAQKHVRNKTRALILFAFLGVLGVLGG